MLTREQAVLYTHTWSITRQVVTLWRGEQLGSRMTIRPTSHTPYCGTIATRRLAGASQRTDKQVDTHIARPGGLSASPKYEPSGRTPGVCMERTSPRPAYADKRGPDNKTTILGMVTAVRKRCGTSAEIYHRRLVDVRYVIY